MADVVGTIKSKNIDYENLKDPKARVQSRMVELYSLKAHRIPLTRKYKLEYRLTKFDDKGT